MILTRMNGGTADGAIRFATSRKAQSGHRSRRRSHRGLPTETDAMFRTRCRSAANAGGPS